MYFSLVQNIILLISISDGPSPTFVFDTLSNEMTKIPSDKRSKHAAISALIGNLPVQTLLAKSPGLVNTLLDSAVVSPSRNHVCCFLVQHKMNHSTFTQVDYLYCINVFIIVFFF